MKKYFPILMSILVFTGFLAIQVGMDLLDSSAKQTGKQKKEQLLYEEIYRTSSFETIKGEKIQLPQTKSPIVIVNFWASWCQPCLKELPSLVKLQEKLSSENLTVLSINTDEEQQAKKISKTVQDFNLNFSIIADKEYKWLNKFHVRALPFSVIYINGKLHEVIEGEKDFMADELVLELQDKIAKK